MIFDFGFLILDLFNPKLLIQITTHKFAEKFTGFYKNSLLPLIVIIKISNSV